MRWARTEEPPEGLRYLPEFLSEAEEHALLYQMATLPFQAVVMHGVTAKRTVVHYGYDYGYDSWTIVPTTAVPPYLQPLRARAAALIEVQPEDLAQVLVSRYPPRSVIGWQRDAPMFGPAVVGISLAAPVTMRFRRTAGDAREIYRVDLAPRSALVSYNVSR